MTDPQRQAVTTVHTDDAPAAVGPYSAGARIPAGAGVLYVSGQLPIDPATGLTTPGGIGEQTTRALRNALAVVEAGGSCLDDVVKTTVYLTDLNEFAAVNEVYAAFFGERRPARAVVEVRRLPKDSAIEVEMIAAVRP